MADFVRTIPERGEERMAYIPERRMTETELCLLSLYTLVGLGPCTDLNLLEFMTDYDLMNYFDLMMSLTDLCKKGHAVRVRQEAGWRYEATPAGRELLDMFRGRVPQSRLDIVDEHSSEWREKLRRERAATAEVARVERGEYEVTLTLNDQETRLIRVTITLPTEDLARRMAAHWGGQAGAVYGEIVSLLREPDA